MSDIQDLKELLKKDITVTTLAQAKTVLKEIRDLLIKILEKLETRNF